MKGAARIILTAVPFIWAGLLVGISFIETPLKFQAPGVTTQIGIGIGNLVFHALNKVETGLLLILLCCYFFSIEQSISFILFLLLVAVVALQTWWLLPSLDERVSMIQQGMQPPASQLHVYYISSEIAKLILLSNLGISAIKSFSNQNHKLLLNYGDEENIRQRFLQSNER